MKKFAGTALVAAGAMILAGCSGGSSDDDGGDKQYQDGGTLTMAISSDPGALAPATAVNGSTNLLLSFAYDTLAYIGEKGDLVPGLASSWKVAPSSVVFTLNKDAKCSDGSPVTPSVVAKSVNHVVDPATKSPLVGVLIPADLKAVADDKAGTVTLNTTAPSQFLLHSTVAIFIVCGKGLTDPSSLDKATSGSGPYELTESVPNDHYTFKVRKDYTWGPGGTSTADKGVPASVVLKVVTNESTAANLLLSGDLNAATFTGADRKRVEKAPGITSTLDPAGNGEFWFNQSAGRPGSNLEVRQALTMALNLDELANISTQGTGIDTKGMTTLSPRPCRVDSVKGTQPEYDTKAAGDKLDDAGWILGSNGVRSKNGKDLAMQILYNTDYGAGTKAEAEYVADAWKKLGVKPKIQATASGAFSDALFKSGDWDWSTVPLGVSLPSQLIGYVSGDPVPEGSNFAHIDNDDYVSLAQEAGGLAIDKGACDKWAEAESALFKNFDVVPVVEYTMLVAAKNAEVFMPGALAQPTRFRLLKE